MDKVLGFAVIGIGGVVLACAAIAFFPNANDSLNWQFAFKVKR